ncbi:hypothetical protein KC322_g51 [Hortaea werneckii]|nr:hypothetical protein KC322_g51 [Hortaea werneckii]
MHLVQIRSCLLIKSVLIELKSKNSPSSYVAALPKYPSKVNHSLLFLLLPIRASIRASVPATISSAVTIRLCASLALFISLPILLDIRSWCELALCPNGLSFEVEDKGHRDEQSRHTTKQCASPVDADPVEHVGRKKREDSSEGGSHDGVGSNGRSSEHEIPKPRKRPAKVGTIQGVDLMYPPQPSQKRPTNNVNIASLAKVNQELLETYLLRTMGLRS